MLNKITALPKRLVSELNKVILELKQIDWITRESAVKSTLLVIAVTIVFVLFLVMIDNLLFTGRSLLLNRSLF